MVIDLQEEEKIKNRNFIIYFHFLHPLHLKGSLKTELADYIRESNIANKSRRKSTSIYFLSRILHAPFNFCNFCTARISQIIGTANNSVYETVKRIKLNNVEIFETNEWLTCLFSMSKTKYTHKWKTIFQHIYEKSNLLVRSDNNTGFSYLKVLQTTTI